MITGLPPFDHIFGLELWAFIKLKHYDYKEKNAIS